MKTNKLFLFGSIVISLFTFMLFACNTTLNDIKSDLILEDEELSLFFESDKFVSLQNIYGWKNDELRIDKVERNDYAEKNVNVFIIPIMDGEKLKGKLLIYSKAKGHKFETVYENWEDFQISKGGKVYVEINALKVAELEYTPMEMAGRYLVKILEVSDSDIYPMTKAQEEFPTSDLGMWECTTKCYKMCKDACGADATCDFVCDLINISASMCTIAISVACGIYCI